ncbi:MAG: metallophosphoesterase, partial [Kangiellaceae bacterium]|nr:metallophosphoesterase [Kangiellaceae bacterium]
DLHLEFEHYNYPVADADVVVLAGDIHTKGRAIDWIKSQIKNKPVIYILGNHEYYKKTYPKLTNDLVKQTEDSNIHVLENRSVEIDGVNFLGCTLWTDFELFGDARLAGFECQQVMNDYKKIRRLPNFAKMRSIDFAVIHKESKKWLEGKLENLQGQRNVVITHHAPSIQSVAQAHHEDITTAAYASNLENLIKHYKPSLWLHGHIHTSSDYLIDNCRVVCNPRGYPGELNPKYGPTYLIEI